jgi:hypothetical protein
MEGIRHTGSYTSSVCCGGADSSVMHELSTLRVTRQNDLGIGATRSSL